MRMRFPILLGLLIAATVSTPAAASVPSWLDTLSKVSVPEYGLQTSAVCLHDENRTVVSDNGDMKDYHRVAYKILTRDGLDLAWLRLSYDNDTKVTDLKAWNLKAGGIVHEASQKDALETQMNSGSGTLFEDTKSLILLVPQVDVGSIVAFEYERRHRPNILQDFWILQSHFPVLRSRVELQLPANWEFQFRMLRRENAQPKEVAKNDWLWELKDLPPIPKEEGMPSLANLSAMLVITYFPSVGTRSAAQGVTLRNWNDFASWTSQLTETRLTPSAEITETARKLATPKALGEFVQNQIRYVAIEIGIGGYQPHLAQDTFRNQFGDCKDKVTLLRSLMKVLNRDVYPVLINADRGGLIPEFPSPLYFNHMIAAIPIAENEPSTSAVIQHPEIGRVLLFDPTDEHTPFGQLPSGLQGTQAVIVRGERAFLVDTPISNVADNRILRIGNFKVADQGTLSGNVSESYWGALAAREKRWLTALPKDEWPRGASRALSRELPGNQVRSFAVGGLDQPSPLQEQYSVEAPSFAQAGGDLLLFRPSVFSGPGQLPVQDETRTYPYQFSFVRSQRSNFNFELPPGYAFEAAPPPVDLDLPFAHFKTETSLDGNTLRYISIYEIKKLEVPAADFEQLRKFYEVVSRSTKALVVLKRTK
jgi:hypothetical protein